MALHSSLKDGTDRLLLAIRHNAKHRREVFKRKHALKNKFLTLVKNKCSRQDIEVAGGIIE